MSESPAGFHLSPQILRFALLHHPVNNHICHSLAPCPDSYSTIIRHLSIHHDKAIDINYNSMPIAPRTPCKLPPRKSLRLNQNIDVANIPTSAL